MADDFINLMPHACTLYDDTKTKLLRTIASEGELRLLSARQVPLPPVGMVAIVTPQSFEGVDPKSAGFARWKTCSRANGVIVSAVAAQYLVDHKMGECDVYSPATGPEFVVRDAEGRTKGCTRLECWRRSFGD